MVIETRQKGQKTMHVGYARVSTQDQNPELQLDALKQAGCDKIYVEKPPGRNMTARSSRQH